MASTTPKVILVTGANQGLGFAVIQVAAQRYPEATYVLASRNPHSGQEAVNKLRGLGIRAIIEVVELDVTNDEQIAAAVDFIKTRFGKLDVLINNAGISGPLRPPESESLSEMRKRYNTVLDTNLTSVAVLARAFTPLLHASPGPSPKVINVSSGLGSMTNALTRKMGRAPAYGASKVGLNGLSVHLQIEENDRVEAGIALEKPRIKTFVVAPGLLRTAFTKFSVGRDPLEGAEPIVRLAFDEDESFEGGTFWEWEGGEMRRVPW
ncbi:hypothetical protein QBC37DRAFT_375320 [Rhypophila decipiens]|uniref:NAD(P)-binding protein n=1 Tax=Rhypophila decipiens TaxID=261697 RepID=A0AAN6Y6A4_9PEZI|nr:hypothetical protein QBC37DRAFT_375320 [Rhypophila decipiens]